jgi:cell division protein FtsA
MDEILTMACKEITRSGCEDILAAGVVLTGGASILEGVPELAEQIFNMPVRRGSPMGIGGLTDVVNSPLYATGVGLVLFGSRHIAREKLIRAEGNFISRLFRRLKQWILEFF